MSGNVNAIDVAYQTEVNIESKTTEQLAAEANTLYRQAGQLAGMSAMMLADTGRRLIEAKKRMPHGEFGKWCEDNLEFSYRKAARTMQLAEKMEDENSLFSKMPTLANIGISRVWALLAAPEEVAAEVVENNDVENMKVRELQEELARVKEEMKAAETEKRYAENNNADLRKELSRLQGQLSLTITEAEFENFKQEHEEEIKAWEDKVREAHESEASKELERLQTEEKLNKTKEDLKKAKTKLKEAEAAKDEEIQKRLAVASAELEEKHADDIKKAKEEGAADAAESLAKYSEEVSRLESEVEKLEAEKAKLSNTTVLEFKIYVDQLQDAYWRANDLITNEEDEALQVKLKEALQKVIEGWRP